MKNIRTSTDWLLTAAALVLCLCLASTAEAGIVRSELNTPSSGSCIGRDYTPEGRATWEPFGSTLESFGWEVQAQTGAGWIPVLAGGQQVNGPLGTFGTLALPSPVDLRMVVNSDDTSGPPRQTISTVKTGVKVDKVAPAPPTDLRVKAVSAHEAIFTFGREGAGPECGNSALWTTLHNPPGSTESIQTTGTTAIVYNLTGGFTPINYAFSAFSITNTGNRSADSNRVTFTTLGHEKSVLAGRVTKGGRPASLVRVTSPSSETMTDADGWYQLPLASGSQTVHYATGCAMPAYCIPIPTTDLTRTGSNDGRLVGGALTL